MSPPFDHPLMSLPKFGDGIGLHRVERLMRRLAIDPTWVSERAIVVTGSNGKGGTARICSALMQAVGGPVGLFTSPHLYRFNERFQVNDRPVDDAALGAAMDQVAGAVAEYAAEQAESVGAFEAQFLTALTLFKAAGCEWIVLEAGIGGRYDPVRLARSPVTGLVSLDLEHTDLLGSTLAEIAFDKIDAAPPGATVILGESCLPLRGRIEAFAALGGRRCRFVDAAQWRDGGVVRGRQAFDLAPVGLSLAGLSSSLIGRHQINNHAVAVELCRERLRASGLPEPSDLARRWTQAIAAVTWPGRLEKIADSPALYIDVGHTPEGVRAALAAFRDLYDPATGVLITGVSQGKDAVGILDVLGPAFGRIIATRAAHKGLAADQVAALASQANPAAEVRIAPDIDDAVAMLGALSPTCAYVAGGLFVAIEFAHAWRGGASSDLRFF